MFRGLRRRGAPKYGSARVRIEGRNFASKLEAAVYEILLLEQRAGLIEEIKCQTQVRLSDAEIIYKPDFEVTRPDGSKYWVEAKGYETPEWRIKRRLWIAYGPGELIIYRGNYRSPKIHETLKGKK